jgi:hypothetical protein
MAWIGVCYEGSDTEFLSSELEKYSAWLNGDRLPRLVGKNLMIIYDSNTAQEFLKKLRKDLISGKVTVYNIPHVLMEFEK